MQKKIIISIIILLLFIVIAIVSYFIIVKPATIKPTKEFGDTAMDKTIASLLNQKATVDDLKKITGIEEIKSSIILGKDSDLHAKLSSKIIEDSKLEKYEKMQKKYVEEIESAYLESLDYKFTKSMVNTNGETIQTIEVKGFYYQTFITDLTALSIKLLEKSGHSLKNLETDSKIQVAFYKAKVKSLEIIIPNLDFYKNKKETQEFTIVCVDGKPKDSGEMMNLLSNLRGSTYSSISFSNSENFKGHQSRVDKYYNDAVKTKKIDEKSPLELK